jgi:DNA repair protein RAD57
MPPSTLYISTESPLPTRRLAQLLSSHPKLVSLPTEHKPRLDRVLSIPCADLEAQDHILRFQVPVAITRYNVSLIVIDSVTANFRAEFDKTTSKEKSHHSTAHGANMARRTTELGRLGMLLRDLAREHNVAVVVSNQVADRFAGAVAPAAAPAFPANWLSQEGGGQQTGVSSTPESPLAYRSAPPSMSQKRGVTGALLPSSLSQTVHPSQSPSSTPVPFPHQQRQTPHRPQPPYHGDPLLIDHQQRFFTGWGDSPYTPLGESLKTPSLGLVWTEQVACRIALVKRAVYGQVEWNWYGDAVQTVKVSRDGGVAAVQSRAVGGAVGEGAGGGAGRRVGPNGEGSEPLVAAGVSTGQGNEQRVLRRAENGGLALKGYKRYVNVVFSAWAAPTGAGGGEAVEYQILREGVRSVTKDTE